MMHGVDISSHQPDWTPAPEDSFVFVKASEGTTYRNPQRTLQVSRARAAGLVVGHYHFMRPGNPREQATHFFESADIQPGDLLVCDWENTNDGHPTVEDAARFIDTVKLLKPAHKVGLYCNASDWKTTDVKAGDFLWIAHYTTADKPGITSAWDFWQYTDKPIDQNESRFSTLAELRAWATTPAPKPDTPPEPEVNHSTKWNTDYVSWNHGQVNLGSRVVTVLDASILDAVQAEVRGTWGTIRLSQGGLSSSVSASANTHNGLGVFDVAVDGRSQSAVWDLCKAFLRAGLVAFPRGYGDGMTPKHIHVVSRESIDNAHPEAQAQLNSAAYGYLHKVLGKRGAGLAGAKWRRYIGPSIELERWHDSPYNPANVTPDDAVYYVNVAPGSSLIGNDIDRNRVTTHERGTPLKIAKRVKRWDRENLATPNGIYYAAQFLSLTKPEDPEPEPGPAPEPA